VHYDWLDAAERTQATVRMLSEQLRRFLDDQAWLENRRVMDILHSVEANALALRDQPALGLTMEIDSGTPTIALPMERPLYTPLERAQVDSSSVAPGQQEFEATSLFEQVYVDPARLSLGIRRALQHSGQVGLAELIDSYPLEQGLAELVTYLSLTDDSFRVVFDEAARQQLSWQDAGGQRRTATLPRVTFARAAAPTRGAR
jgi:hypothetical protein